MTTRTTNNGNTETTTMMTSITLNEYETSQWESTDARERDRARFDFRAILHGDCDPGTHVEIYSHDGITLDAWEV